MSHSHPSVTSSKHFPHIECGPEFQYVDRQRELVRGPAFDLWANEHRQEQLRKHSKTTPDQLTRILCDLWDQLPQSERDVYLERTGSAPLSSNKSNQEMEAIKPGVNIDPSYKLNKRTINLEQELGRHHEQGEGEKQSQEQQWQKEKPSDEFDAEKQLSMKERLTDTLSTLATNVTDKLPTSVQNMLHLKPKEESGETISSADTNVSQTNQPSSKLNKPEVEMPASENQESLSSLDESSKDQEQSSSLKSKLGLNKLTDTLSDVSDSLQSKVHDLKDSIKQKLHLGGEKIDSKDSGMLGKEEIIHTDAPTDEESNKEAPKDVESTGTSSSLLGGVSTIVSSIKENVVGKEDERLPEKPAAPVWQTEEIQKGGLDTEESSFGIKETIESLSEPSVEQESGISGGSRKNGAFSTQASGLPKNVKHRFAQSQHHQEPKQTHLASRQRDSGGEGKPMNKNEKFPHELHPEAGFEMTHEKHKDVNLADSSLSQLTEDDALQMQSRQRALDALQKAKVKEAQQTGVKHDLKGKEDALSGKKQDSASANLHQLLSGTHHEPGKNKQKQGKKWAKGKYHMQEEIGNIAREGNFHLTPESNKHDKRVAYQHSEIKHVPYEPQPKGRT